jgi:hypothetical protein
MDAVALARGEEALAQRRFERTLEIDPLNVEARQGLAAVAESRGPRRCTLPL